MKVTSEVHATVHSCVSHGRIVTSADKIKTCSKSQGNSVSWEENSETRYYIPYPAKGASNSGEMQLVLLIKGVYHI